MMNKASISVIAALIGLSLSKKNEKKGSKNLSVLRSYEHSLRNNLHNDYISEPNYYDDTQRRNKLYNSSRVESRNTSISLKFSNNGDISERLASQVFINLGHLQFIEITTYNINEHNRNHISTLVKRYLLPNISTTHISTWGNRQTYKSTSNVQYLNLSGLNLIDSDLTEMFRYTRYLRFLILSDNNFINLSENIRGYSQLYKLDLSNNTNLYSFSTFKGMCKGLVSLNIENTNIKSLPTWVGNIDTLEELQVDYDCFFPTSVKKLKNINEIIFKVKPTEKFNNSIFNFINVNNISFRYYSHNINLYNTQKPSSNIYNLKNLESFSIRSYNRNGLNSQLIEFKFPKPKQNQNHMENIKTCYFGGVTISGRYDHIFSKAEKIDLYRIIIKKTRNLISNEKTKIYKSSQSTLDCNFLETLHKLQTFSATSIVNAHEITEINFSNMKDLRSFSISGGARKPLLLENLKNIDQCQKIHTIRAIHTRLTDISDIPISKLRNITIKNNTGIVKLPDFSDSTKRMYFDLQRCTIESLTPFINLRQNCTLYVRDVTLIKPLTTEEKITLINNNALSRWAKHEFLQLSASVKVPGNIRTR